MGDLGRGRIVVAEDDRVNRTILVRRLTAAGYEVAVAEDGLEAWEAILAEPPEVLVSDWTMPRLSGFDLCRQVKESRALRSVYCILLTGRDGIDDLVCALDGGADDYIPKPFDMTELLARVRTGLRVHRLHSKLEKVSITDAVTGLRNRGYFDCRLDEEVSRSRRYNTPLSLVMVDLDGFKRINDEFGHPVGDEVLVSVARSLEDRVRASDVATRFGGDEFAVLLPNTGAEGAAVFAHAIEETLTRTTREDGIRISGAAGWAELGCGADAADLIRAADESLYERKRSRTPARNTVPNTVPGNPAAVAGG